MLSQSKDCKRSMQIKTRSHENDDPEDSTVTNYLNKRKAILMSTNKVKLPTQVQKRIHTAQPRPNSVFTAPTQDLPNSTPSSFNFSQSGINTNSRPRLNFSESSNSASKNSIYSQSSSQSNSSRRSSFSQEQSQ